jgi:hypothetical protein
MNTKDVSQEKQSLLLKKNFDKLKELSGDDKYLIEK